MGFMSSLERGLERAVNSAFARTFKSGVQPVEIAAAIKREMDVNSYVVDRDRVLAPNQFTIQMSQADSDRLASLGTTLSDELENVIIGHANQQGYHLLGPAITTIAPKNFITVGTIEVVAHKPDSKVTWVPAIDVNGKRHLLRQGSQTVGRGTDAQIRITDAGASRKHLEIIWSGKRVIARDLGSTNGSKINGQRFREVQLQPETIITIGETALRYRLVPAPETTTPQAKTGFWEGA